MIKSDGQNLELVETARSVDSLNAGFYGRFPFPWTPMNFSYLADDAFEATMLNQEVGDYAHATVPRDARVWVAGCGTNQAIYTALRFPRSSVLGSDLSEQSLELCRGAARELNLSHVELARESVNDVSYENAFDYVVCTGVIHHNADPKAALAKLAAALKPKGVLELMVYNRHHRTPTTSFQKALRVLRGPSDTVDFDGDLRIAKDLIHGVPDTSPLAVWLSTYKDSTEPELADALMQPVEYSFTVQSLSELAASCGLELILPCLNQFDVVDSRISWNMTFRRPELQARYDSLADPQRWHVTNLLMAHRSPMLWFYLRRRSDGGTSTEKQTCNAFLDTTFIRNGTMKHTFRRAGDRNFILSPRAVPYPPPAQDRQIAQVLAGADGKTRMRDILARLDIAPTFHTVNSIRMRSTTPAFPYLKAVT